MTQNGRGDVGHERRSRSDPTTPQRLPTGSVSARPIEADLCASTGAISCGWIRWPTLHFPKAVTEPPA